MPLVIDGKQKQKEKQSHIFSYYLSPNQISHTYKILGNSRELHEPSISLVKMVRPTSQTLLDFQETW